MRIGVDTRELTKNKAGKGWYVFHVLNNLLKIDKENQYILYSDQVIDFSVYKNASKVVLRTKGLLWHFAMLSQLKKDKVDIYWAPTSPIVPALTSIPTVITIHDLTNFLFPEMHTLKGRLIEKIFLGRAVRKTRKIIADSMSTKNDIIKFYPESKAKTEVTLLGYDDAFKPLPDEEVATILEKYKLKTEYILFVGTLEPRKNITRIVESYSSLDEKTRNDHPLVLVGRKGWKFEQIFETIDESKAKNNIIVLDYVPFSDLPALYNGARAFVFPSLYEGFGLPPLEAMACGTPVITSNISSLPEVVGGAGMLVDPYDIKDIAEKINRILSDDDLRQQLSNLAIEQSKKFSWLKTAERTLEIFNSI